MAREYSILGIIQTLKKWKKQIIITTVLVALLSLIITLFMPDYYKSTALAYPASEDLSKPIPLGSYERPTDIYGNNDELDRLLSIATSQEFTFAIIDHFNLYKSYEIKENSPKAKFQIFTRFWELFSVSKTKYDALELTAEDKDPEMAKKIVDYSIVVLDSLSQNIIKTNQLTLSKTLSLSIENKLERQKILNDSLSNLRDSYGVLSTEFQGEVLSKIKSNTKAKLSDAKSKLEFYKKNAISRDSLNKYRAETEGLTGKMMAVDDEVNNYNKGYSLITSLEKQLRVLQDQLAFDLERKNLMDNAEFSQNPSLIIIQPATYPNYKSRPLRSLIILGATFFAFIFSCLAVLLIDGYKSVL
ncbi:MAG TPA: Wzz/FepE/Etk N-terminal domain-containing protein [Saprospiraceae bacterium]|nr:Wzz/FepE/Etk N-terminal domain-containing protein [Saprospiraceae bacterium]